MFLRAPESWPQAAVAVVAMLMLAALDLAGALVAKEAVLRRSPVLGAVGVLLFVALFWTYASSLQYAELAPITLGWVVLLQVGVLLLDRYRYDVTLPVGKWVAIVIILAAQGYLLLGKQPSPPTPVPAAVAPASASAPASSACPGVCAADRADPILL